MTTYRGRITASGAARFARCTWPLHEGQIVTFTRYPPDHPAHASHAKDIYDASGRRVGGILPFAGGNPGIEPLEPLPPVES